jgi:serine/threonine protein kinase
MAHNRLSTESVLCDKEGQIFINVVKSTSKALNYSERENMFEYSPEILFAMTKSSSRRSDIWSIGILLLDMLFNFEALDPSYMSFHPYNTSEQKMSKDDAIIVDNLKQMYPNFVKSDKKPGLEKEILRKFG